MIMGCQDRMCGADDCNICRPWNFKDDQYVGDNDILREEEEERMAEAYDNAAEKEYRRLGGKRQVNWLEHFDPDGYLSEREAVKWAKIDAAEVFSAA